MNLTYLRPESLNEALMMLQHQPEQNMVLAGGTDIIPGLRQQARRFQRVSRLIDISGLDELRFVYSENGKLYLGAATTFSDIAADPFIHVYLPVLSQAAASIGSVQIRNRATIAGNFINNAPCADSMPALLVYDAIISLQSADGKRQIAISDLPERPYHTTIQPDEIVTHIEMPLPAKDFRGEFYKLGRRRGVAISRISLAVLVRMKQQKIQELRIASGAITPVGRRFEAIEKSVCNQCVDDTLLMHIAQETGRHILGDTGVRWSTHYKLPVVQQMLFRILSGLMLTPQV